MSNTPLKKATTIGDTEDFVQKPYESNEQILARCTAKLEGAQIAIRNAQYEEREAKMELVKLAADLHCWPALKVDVRMLKGLLGKVHM